MFDNLRADIPAVMERAPIRAHIVALERRVSELEEQMHNHCGTTVFKEDIQDDADL